MGEYIVQLLADSGIAGEVYEDEDGVISVAITWGDWKHDHLRLVQIIEDRTILQHFDQQVTESDESDCYSAIHRFRI